MAPYWLSIKLDHIHNFCPIIRILARQKLHESKPLMPLRDPVFWKIDIHDRTHLEKQLPHERLSDAFVYVADVDGVVLVACVSDKYERFPVASFYLGRLR